MSFIARDIIPLNVLLCFWISKYIKSICLALFFALKLFNIIHVDFILIYKSTVELGVRIRVCAIQRTRGVDNNPYTNFMRFPLKINADEWDSVSNIYQFVFVYDQLKNSPLMFTFNVYMYHMRRSLVQFNSKPIAPYWDIYAVYGRQLK